MNQDLELRFRRRTGLVDPCADPRAIQFRLHLVSSKERAIRYDADLPPLAVEFDSLDLRRLSNIQSQRYQRRLDSTDEQLTRDKVLKLCTLMEQARSKALTDAIEAAFSAAAEAQRSAYSCPSVEIPRYEESYKLPSGTGIVTGSLLAPCGVHYTPFSPDTERITLKKDSGVCSIS